MLRFAPVMAATVLIAVAGCSTTSSVPAAPVRAWARADGQTITGNPTLLAQAKKDTAECRAAAASPADSIEPCMQARGYYVDILSPGEPSTPVPEG